MFTFLSQEGYAIFGTRFEDPDMGSCKFEGICDSAAEFAEMIEE